ncbi:hypothetical protein Tsubulata_016929 [Turnera subulata]|uniref:Protein phosphatase n=1 Tax=Turnera subulata TaxID=218843 RepID=A0A9Q0FFZ9_9ROSI|nr:hypothetical protein Tsubulata_016927 [Turnera subulata]KAJ4830793.1 hypothetical protein Tsubulata_016929 [Turnera subulata]
MIIKKRKLSDGEAQLLREEKLPKLRMTAGSLYLPKEDESKPEGEDAHFVSEESQTIAVADGVSAWTRKGIDAGVYARELMNNAVAGLALEPRGEVNPRRVILHAHSRTAAQGSSTACLVTLGGRTLRYANVGDSGFMVFRNKKLVYQSPTQQRRFNCPYTLRNGREALVFEGEFGVEPGDLVVLGTDGVFDNLYSSEIEEILQETEGNPSPEEIASTIACTASLNSGDLNYKSPFECVAELEGVEHKGGKFDDISVIVAQIESKVLQ